MASTLERFDTKTDRTDENAAPDPDVFERAVKQPFDLGAQIVGPAEVAQRHLFVVRSVPAALSAPSSRMASFLSFEQTDDAVICSDLAGAAYGIGPDIASSFADWLSAAREHYDDLIEHAAALHPRMQRQLNALRQLFG